MRSILIFWTFVSIPAGLNVFASSINPDVPTTEVPSSGSDLTKSSGSGNNQSPGSKIKEGGKDEYDEAIKDMQDPSMVYSFDTDAYIYEVLDEVYISSTYDEDSEDDVEEPQDIEDQAYEEQYGDENDDEEDYEDDDGDEADDNGNENAESLNGGISLQDISQQSKRFNPKMADMHFAIVTSGVEGNTKGEKEREQGVEDEQQYKKNEEDEKNQFVRDKLLSRFVDLKNRNIPKYTS